MVVTEMNTPMRALARRSVSDTTPTIPASTATMTEKMLGVLMRSATGRTPSRKADGVLPDARAERPNSRVTTMAARKPQHSASKPSRTSARTRLLRPSATPMIALYSGPTIMAPTIRICELVSRPTAPIRPATASRT